MSPFFTQKNIITVGALEIPGRAETCVAWASFGQMAIFWLLVREIQGGAIIKKCGDLWVFQGCLKIWVCLKMLCTPKPNDPNG
jgi:hypothetical protein